MVELSSKDRCASLLEILHLNTTKILGKYFIYGE